MKTNIQKKLVLENPLKQRVSSFFYAFLEKKSKKCQKKFIKKNSLVEIYFENLIFENFKFRTDPDSKERREEKLRKYFNFQGVNKKLHKKQGLKSG